MHGIIGWIVVGLIAGWLAGKVMKGGGYGVLVDIVLGILGGILGGWLFGMLGHFHGWRIDRRDYRGVHRRGDPGLDHTIGEEGISAFSSKFSILPAVRATKANHAGCRG